MSNTIKSYNGRELSREEVLGEVPKAWHPIVLKLIDDLFAAGWDGRLDQIKEKFGSLRFYISIGNAEIWNLIEAAEAATESICQYCGKPATKVNGGWITYVCDDHYRNEPGAG